MNVSKLMSRNVQTCAPNETMFRAAQLMFERDCGSVAIVGKDGALKGIVTDRDVCIAAYRTEKTLRDIPLSSAMSEQVKVCTPDTSMKEVERMMRELRVRRLPVVDGEGNLVGMVSLGDIAREAVGAGADAEHEVSKTLAAVSEPSKPRAAAMF